MSRTFRYDPGSTLDPTETRRHVHPLLQVGQRTVDLSILCPGGVPPPRRSSKCRESPLYPDMSTVERIRAVTASEAFRRASNIRRSADQSERNSVAPVSLNRQHGRITVHSTTDQLQRCCYTATAALSHQPPKVTWIEQHDDHRKKLDSKPVSLPAGSSFSKKEHSPIRLGPPARLPFQNSSPDTEDHTNAAMEKQIEVTPGEYMTLRGSMETMNAVDGGYAARLSCFACEAILMSVPDAKLVICPDCLTLSPIPEACNNTDGYGRRSLPAIPHAWEEELEDRSYASSYCGGETRRRSDIMTFSTAHCRRRNQWGVGLGLKC